MQEEHVTAQIRVDGPAAALRAHFGQCFDKDGRFDIDKFKREIAVQEGVDFSRESYGMDWLGKSYARLLASDSATTLLKEDPQWNAKPENTASQNLLLKGDNLEILKHLSHAYEGAIKMIYIDPPYNTGSDGFVYEDDRTFTPREFAQLAGVEEEKAQRILDFVSSKSNSHSAWLTFMYPRLYIARQLLKDDGVIFVSIDENEVAQLRILMDEVFGEENYAGDIVWKNSSKNDESFISMQHEYVLAYTRDRHRNSGGWFERKEGLEEIFSAFDGFRRKFGTDWQKIHEAALAWFKEFPESNPIYDSKHYSWMDERGVYFPDNISGPNFGQYRYTILHPVTGKPCKEPASGWRYPEETMLQRISEKRVHFGEDETTVPNNKTYLKDTQFQSLTSVKYRDGRVASNRLKDLLGGNYFTNPKDPAMLARFFRAVGIKDDDLVLDCFAGSATTADAVMQLNAEDDGNRRFILAQLPEAIDPKKNKTAYDFVHDELGVAEPTIFDITKERIVRAGKKIKEEKKDDERVQQLDTGFKVFEAVPLWEGYDEDQEEYAETLNLFNVSKLSEVDLQTLLTTWKTYDGVPLTEPAQAVDLGGYTAYYAGTKLYLLHAGFHINHLQALLEKIDADPAFAPTAVVAFAYNFESARMRELAEGVKSYANKKNVDLEFVGRY